MPNIERQAVAYETSNQLLLNALLKGLAHAIRRDDVSTASRYRGRLQRAAEPVAADAQLKELLTTLLLTSELWAQAADIERDKTSQQLLDLTDGIVALLTSSGPPRE